MEARIASLEAQLASKDAQTEAQLAAKDIQIWEIHRLLALTALNAALVAMIGRSRMPRCNNLVNFW